MIIEKKKTLGYYFHFLGGPEMQNISKTFAHIFIDSGTFRLKNKPVDKKKRCFEHSRLRDELELKKIARDTHGSFH